MFPCLAGIRLCRKAVSGGGAGQGRTALLEHLLPAGHKGVCFGIPRWHSGKVHLSIQETQVRSLGQEDTLTEEMATHSSILAWEIPWTEEPDGL